jgi:DNA mismatch repair protein MutL
MPIRRLAPSVVNQIAAGEVVERPASVVKEVLENAFDAGARRVDIEITGGGRDFIRIADDGAGIPADELALAVEAHATSKIESVADLEKVSTMGFRGEALASIASVSRFALESRTQNSDEAWRIEVTDGVIGSPAPTAGPPGTRVEVRNLFHTVPARRRFLKSETAESARIAEVVRLLALARPTIGFRLVSNGRCLLDLPATDDPRRRIVGVLGEELDGRLIEVRGEIGSPADGTLTSVWGLVGLPETARPTAKNQRFILNGRAITDRSLSHALKEGFRGLVEPGRHPVGVCYLEMNPARVDVNVHPAKTEVRFREARPLHGLVRHAVQEALQEADLVRNLTLKTKGDPSADESMASGRATIAHRMPPPGSGSGVGGASPSSPFSTSSSSWFREEREVARSRTASGVNLDRIREAIGDVPMPNAAPRQPITSAAEVLPTLVGSDAVLQVHQSFLVTQDAEGLVIIDQHALHERVMFEKLHDRCAAGPLESQRQLVPIVFDADPASIAALESLAPLLVRLGIDATAAGPRGVAIHGFPTLLLTRRVDPGPFLSELLERAAQGEIDRDDHEAALADVLDVMSCKAAVKAGDRLGEREIAELLAMRDRIDREGSCPHGRPTHLRIPIAELERRFGRSPA